VWDVQAKITECIWEWELTGEEVRRLVDEMAERSYHHYGPAYLTNEALEKSDVTTVGDFIHEFMVERYLTFGDEILFKPSDKRGRKAIIVTKQGIVKVRPVWTESGYDS
jgi:hypothetical protein